MRIHKFVGMRTCALTLTVSTLILSGCGSKSPNAEGSHSTANLLSTLGGDPVNLTTTIFTDSFEDDGCINQIKNWTTLVTQDSCRKSALFSKHLGYGTYNFSDEAVGPVPDGHRALYFFGSSGGYSGHEDRDIHLVTPPFTITGLSSIQISFAYQVIGLNSQQPQACSRSNPHTGEFFKLEACNGTAEDCVTGASQWTELFAQDGAVAWSDASLTLQTSDLDTTKPLFIDFHVRLDAGLAPGAEFTHTESCCRIPDHHLSFIEAAAIDKVLVTGTSSGGGEGPGGGDPGEGGEGPGGGTPDPS
jgi:hypothetical protein